MAAVPIDHPNAPRRRVLGIAFAGISISGVLGGLIGYSLVRVSCSDKATVAQHLLEQVHGYHAHVPSCTWKLLGGALAGTLFAAIGAGVVAMLMLRVQSEWRAHPPRRR